MGTAPSAFFPWAGAGRLISHAPRLGRPEVNDSPPPVYAARSPAPLTRGKGGAPLRTGDNICPHAPRLRGRQSIRRGDGAASDTAGCKSIRRGEERAEPRSVRAGINRGSERAWASGRNSVAMATRSGDPGGRRVRPPPRGEPRRVRGRANGVSTGKALAVGIQAEAAGSP